MKKQVRGAANGGIGRGELFALSLVLCLSGSGLGGAGVAGGVRGWLVLLLMAAGLWGGLVAYSRFVAGRRPGGAWVRAFRRVICLLPGLAWLMLAVCGARDAAELWLLLDGAGDLPAWLCELLFLLVAGLMAAAGARALSRVAGLVVVPALLLVLGNVALTLSGADWGNVLPVEESDWGEALTGGMWAGLLSVGGLSALLPYHEKLREPEELGGVGLAGAIAVLLMAGLALGCRVVLSVGAGAWQYPIVQVFRLAEVGHWFSRFEVLGVGLLVALLLVRVAALLWAAAKVIKMFIKKIFNY